MVGRIHVYSDWKYHIWMIMGDCGIVKESLLGSEREGIHILTSKFKRANRSKDRILSGKEMESSFVSKYYESSILVLNSLKYIDSNSSSSVVFQQCA